MAEQFRGKHFNRFQCTHLGHTNCAWRGSGPFLRIFSTRTVSTLNKLATTIRVSYLDVVSAPRSCPCACHNLVSNLAPQPRLFLSKHMAKTLNNTFVSVDFRLSCVTVLVYWVYWKWFWQWWVIYITCFYYFMRRGVNHTKKSRTPLLKNQKISKNQ